MCCCIRCPLRTAVEICPVILCVGRLRWAYWEIYVSDDLCSGMSYNVPGCEFSMNESAIHIKWGVSKHTMRFCIDGLTKILWAKACRNLAPYIPPGAMVQRSLIQCPRWLYRQIPPQVTRMDCICWCMLMFTQGVVCAQGRERGFSALQPVPSQAKLILLSSWQIWRLFFVERGRFL